MVIAILGMSTFLFGLYLLFRHKQKKVPIVITLVGFLLLVLPYLFLRLYLNPLG